MKLLKLQAGEISNGPLAINPEHIACVRPNNLSPSYKSTIEMSGEEIHTYLEYFELVHRLETL